MWHRRHVRLWLATSNGEAAMSSTIQLHPFSVALGAITVACAGLLAVLWSLASGYAFGDELRPSAISGGAKGERNGFETTLAVLPDSVPWTALLFRFLLELLRIDKE